MTFERSSGPPPEPGPTPVAGGGSSEPTPVQIRLQILSTEHWSLLASRSLAWNESFARAGMYLSTLSGAMVALGLIAGIDKAGDTFFAFALVVLPVELFIGIGTLARMSASNYHDAIAVFGMNRIRGAYLEIAPELEPYFVMGVHDDPPGIAVTMAIPPSTPTLVHILAATPFMLNVLNAIVSGAIAALLVVRPLDGDLGPTLLVSLLVAVVAFALQSLIAGREIRRGQDAIRPMFPTPGDRPGA
jgi:hypothetical protein